QYNPLPVAMQVISIFSGVRGLVDDIKVADLQKFEAGLRNFIEEKHQDLLETIDREKKLDGALEAKLAAAIKEFKELF
ncbi:MAG: F0F1 ATP synthase subunit alpha, partial [Nitrospinaceae bacterium]